MDLPELLRRCANGDEEFQEALLDEVEPLLFGYLRSLVPAGDESFDRAVAGTHAALLGFLLDVRGDRVRLADSGALRGHCHRIALRVLEARPPAALRSRGDPETGRLTPVAVALAREVEAAVPERERGAVGAYLQGARGDGDARRTELLRAGGLLRG